MGERSTDFIKNLGIVTTLDVSQVKPAPYRCNVIAGTIRGGTGPLRALVDIYHCQVCDILQVIHQPQV